MKNIFLLLIVFLMIHQLDAQTNLQTDRFIEVKVSDTIKVIPDYIEAFVRIEEEDDIDYTGANENKTATAIVANKMNPAKQKVEVERLISEISTTYTFTDKASDKLLGKEFNLWNNGYTVILKNMDEYNKLAANINKSGKASISIKTMETKNTESNTSRILEKTMNKANKEASQLAKLMNVTIDKPISIKNYDENALSYGDNSSNNYFNALYSMMGSMYGNINQENYVVISKTLIVRYLYK